MKKNVFLILFFISLNISAQDKAENYIEEYKDIAISEMYMFGIPASITLAQAILESGHGKSRLAIQGKNHFGIKCHSNWNGKTIIEDDDLIGECFRKYNKVKDSYRDHSLFLAERERYSFLFKYDRKDYESWARGLQRAGYATNPKYSDLLIDLIERHKLDRFDEKQNNENQLYFSKTYGFPYLFGLGIDYFKEKNLYSLDLQSSFIFSKGSIGYNYNLINQLYTGANIDVIYFPSVDNKVIPQFSFGLLYKKKLVDKKNKYLLIKIGIQLPIFSDPLISYNGSSHKFNYSLVQYFPYIELRYLIN
tara:strand:- start:219 stop:1136 length:918 start_codon:yes stop_codon:yes gene_type:complete